MYTSDRLWIASAAEESAAGDEVVMVAVDWDQVDAIQNGLRALFPDNTRLSHLPGFGEKGHGVIRLQGRDRPYGECDEAALFLKAAALGTRARGDDSARLYGNMIRKEGLDRGGTPILELPIARWDEVEDRSGVIVARGILEAVHMIEPIRPDRPRPGSEDLVRLALGTLQRDFPNPMVLIYGIPALAGPEAS